LVFLGKGEPQAEPVSPLQPPGVIHAPQDRLGRHGPVAEIEESQGNADRAVLDPQDQAVELGRRTVVFISPDPKRSVDVEPVPVGLRVAGRRLGLVQVIIEHGQEGVAVRIRVGRPEVIGVVVVGDVDALLLGGEKEDDQQDESGGGELAFHVSLSLPFSI